MITGNMHVKRKYVRYQDKMLKLHMKNTNTTQNKTKGLSTNMAMLLLILMSQHDVSLSQPLLYQSNVSGLNNEVVSRRNE